VNQTVAVFYIFSGILTVIAVMLMAWFVRCLVLRFRLHPETQTPLRVKKRVRDTFYAMLALIFFFAGLAVFNFSLFLQSYHIFAEGTPIAWIEVGAEQEDTFHVYLQTIDGDAQGEKKDYLLHGEKWLLEGNIVRFQPWLYFVGVKPVYQLSRLQGGYFSIEDEKMHSRSIYGLSDEADTPWWRTMYDFSARIPFVEITYGTAVSQSAMPAKYQLSLLPTGFALSYAETP
jgi:hypothetical protein